MDCQKQKSSTLENKSIEQLRHLLWEVSNATCEYCKFLERYASGPFHVEHIIPVALGGTSIFMNLAYSCAFCNQFKAAFTTGFDALDRREVSLFHPRRQIWTDHFEWSDDKFLIIGRTPTGRATVERLNLNRFQNQNQRRIALGNGHPPLNSLLNG